MRRRPQAYDLWARTLVVFSAFVALGFILVLLLLFGGGAP